MIIVKCDKCGYEMVHPASMVRFDVQRLGEADELHLCGACTIGLRTWLRCDPEEGEHNADCDS